MRVFLSLILGATAALAISNGEMRPVEVLRRDLDDFLDRQSTGLAVRSQDRDLDIRAPAKSHPNITTDLLMAREMKSNTFLSIGFSVIPTAATIISLVTGCIGIDKAGPIGSTSCAAALIASVLGVMGSTFHLYRGLTNIVAFVDHNNIQLGNRRPPANRPGGRRSIDDTMTMTHEEYMASVLHSAGLKGTHIGYHERESMNFTSPAFHFHGQDGYEFVYTISPHDDGSIRHTFSFHHDTVYNKRGVRFEGVRVNGGMDVQACQNRASNWEDFPTSARDAYEYYYKDVECLLRESDLSSNYVYSDIFDKSGNSGMTVSMTPFKDHQPNLVSSRAACSKDDFRFEDKCVF